MIRLIDTIFRFLYNAYHVRTLKRKDGKRRFMLRFCSFLRGVYAMVIHLTKRSYRNMAIIATGSCCIAVIALNSNSFGGGGKNNVVAARNTSTNEESDEEEDAEESDTEIQAKSELSSLVESIQTPSLVAKGQKIALIEVTEEECTMQPELTKAEHLTTINTVAEPDDMENVEEQYEATVYELAANLGISLSEEDYEVLLRIVEAEATGEDYIGKRLVANVIINRVKNDSFPETVEDVVFQRVSGHVQFSPTADGRYNSVTVSEETITAVYDALEGEDTSKGALFFSARSKADPSNMSWFDNNLKWLFTYGGHDFYTLQ